MFKKAFKVASHEPIAPKDRKKLKRTLYKAFNEEAVDRLFIDSSELSETKLSTKAIIYSNQDFPLFVDITGSGDFIPSSIEYVLIESLRIGYVSRFGEVF